MQAYAEEGGATLSALRRPLLPRSGRPLPPGSEGGDVEVGSGWMGGGQGSNWWSSAALLASSALGIGECCGAGQLLPQLQPSMWSSGRLHLAPGA